MQARPLNPFATVEQSIDAAVQAMLANAVAVYAGGAPFGVLFDRASGETLIAIAGIPCATVMNAADVERIIEAVEDELESFVPPLSLRA